MELSLKCRSISSTAYKNSISKKNVHSNESNSLKTFTLTRKQRAALRLVEEKEESSQRKDQEEDNNGDSKLTRALLDLKRQAQEQEEFQRQKSPLPWYSLLLHPSQALWRSSPHPPPSYIHTTSQDTIKLSERTSKQLKRTQDRIISHYTVMSDRRERERRNMVQSSKSSTTSYNKTSILHKEISLEEKSIKPTYYKPEYTVANMKYRLVPNYCILKRILKETHSLLGPNVWFPKHVLDVGMGIGSASAATLDFFFELQQKQQNQNKHHYPYKESTSTYQGIEWVHGIEPSQSMKDAASILLQSVMEGHDRIQQEELQECRRLERNKIRFTMDHGIVPTTSKSISSTRITSTNQSFDLALCSYTLCEIPSVQAVLSMSAMIWEKIRPGGVAIFVEPGTPDGFNALRSVRNMLLDCCPPSENVHYEDDDEEELYNELPKETCHVIAPCTHNGTCPMVRHRRNFQRNTKGTNDEVNNDDMEEDEWNDDDDYDEDNSMEDENEWEDEHDEYVNESISFESKTTSTSTSSSSNTQPHAFESAFCSFVHGMPGKEQGNQGEKFSYLVVQKRIRGEDTKRKEMDEKYNPFHNMNLVDLLKESMNKKKDGVSSTKSRECLEKAVQIEDEYLDSTLDGLGLELVRGENTSHWGRIVRAPIKKKGHVIIDYCSNVKSNHKNDNGTDNDENERHGENVGVIHRLMVTKSQSSKCAPGMYSSSRKARWGGFWPDVR